jgi:hypothetical protein
MGHLLAAPLWAGSVSERDLRRVQRPARERSAGSESPRSAEHHLDGAPSTSRFRVRTSSYFAPRRSQIAKGVCVPFSHEGVLSRSAVKPTRASRLRPAAGIASPRRSRECSPSRAFKTRSMP